MKMSRRKVRETIFLLLFRIEFNTQEELQEQMKWYFEERPDVEAKDQLYIETKIGSILKRLPEIDDKIHSICEGWRLERLGKPELAILRLAVYEITNDANIPTGVAINEAVELAKCFGSEESGAFVNGILGKIANPDKKVAARKASSKKEEQTSARPKSGFKVKDPSKKVVVVNRNVSSRAPENKNE